LIEKEKISTMGFLNMRCFGRWGCARMKHMLESLGESTLNPFKNYNHTCNFSSINCFGNVWTSHLG
jgi:hypothetical protein